MDRGACVDVGWADVVACGACVSDCEVRRWDYGRLCQISFWVNVCWPKESIVDPKAIFGASPFHVSKCRIFLVAIGFIVAFCPFVGAGFMGPTICARCLFVAATSSPLVIPSVVVVGLVSIVVITIVAVAVVL